MLKTHTDKKAPFVIAEIGINHNGDLDLAKRLIDIAVECGGKPWASAMDPSYSSKSS